MPPLAGLPLRLSYQTGRDDLAQDFFVPCLIPPRRFQPPQSFEPRPYQIDAIRAWSKAGGKGILAMATGSVKTLTALALVSKVAEKNQPLVMIVVCPFINLCRQWIREIAAFGLDAVACFEGRKRWQEELEESYQSLSAGLAPVHAIVTISTKQKTALKELL